MDTDTATCGTTWEFTRAERAELLEAGVSASALDSIEHDCCLDEQHDGTHVCSCGVSS